MNILLCGGGGGGDWVRTKTRQHDRGTQMTSTDCTVNNRRVYQPCKLEVLYTPPQYLDILSLWSPNVNCNATKKYQANFKY